jgi:hypothetical protein
MRASPQNEGHKALADADHKLDGRLEHGRCSWIICGDASLGQGDGVPVSTRKLPLSAVSTGTQRAQRQSCPA